MEFTVSPRPLASHPSTRTLAFPPQLLTIFCNQVQMKEKQNRNKSKLISSLLKNTEHYNKTMSIISLSSGHINALRHSLSLCTNDTWVQVCSDRRSISTWWNEFVSNQDRKQTDGVPMQTLTPSPTGRAPSVATAPVQSIFALKESTNNQQSHRCLFFRSNIILITRTELELKFG